MSVREEDRQKTSCPSRGLGLAAAAIGVGVGAALYYFLSKKPENPDAEGSTTEGWSCERQAFDSLHDISDADSYTTISEHSTTDTSMHTDEGSENIELGNSYIYDEESSQPDDSGPLYHLDHSYYTTSSVSDLHSNNSYADTIENMDLYSNDGLSDTIENTESSSQSEQSIDSHSPADNSLELDYLMLPTMDTSSFETETNILDWDVTESVIGLPSREMSPVSPLRMMIDYLSGALLSPYREISRRTTEEEQMAMLRDQAFRDRSWSLEECSICFDVILKDQRVTKLPCTHNFHADCIAPWLREQQTCPNCRKTAE